MARLVFGHAVMVCAGTLNTGDAHIHGTEPVAREGAREASSRTSLAVMFFQFPEGHLKDGMKLLGGFEECREMTAQEARDRLRGGYGAAAAAEPAEKPACFTRPSGPCRRHADWRPA